MSLHKEQDNVQHTASTQIETTSSQSYTLDASHEAVEVQDESHTKPEEIITMESDSEEVVQQCCNS